METRFFTFPESHDKVFKSYYVVWKPDKFYVVWKLEILFKSYYVVWKQKIHEYFKFGFNSV